MKPISPIYACLAILKILTQCSWANQVGVRNIPESKRRDKTIRVSFFLILQSAAQGSRPGDNLLKSIYGFQPAIPHKKLT